MGLVRTKPTRNGARGQPSCFMSQPRSPNPSMAKDISEMLGTLKGAKKIVTTIGGAS